MLLMMVNYNASLQCTQDQTSLAKARLSFPTTVLVLRLFAFTVARQTAWKMIRQSIIHVAKFALVKASRG